MDNNSTELVSTGSRLHKIYRRSSDSFLDDQAMAEYQRWSDEQRRIEGQLRILCLVEALAVGTLMWIALIHFAGPTLAYMAHFLHIF